MKKFAKDIILSSSRNTGIAFSAVSKTVRTSVRKVLAFALGNDIDVDIVMARTHKGVLEACSSAIRNREQVSDELAKAHGDLS